jgi:hypothetical protein
MDAPKFTRSQAPEVSPALAQAPAGVSVKSESKALEQAHWCSE